MSPKRILSHPGLIRDLKLALSNGEIAAAIQTLRTFSTLPPLDEVAEDEPDRRVIIEYTPLGMKL